MRMIPMTLALVMASTWAVAARADETTNRSAELQVLERFVGAWDVEATLAPKGGQETRHKTVSSRAWSLGGKFIRFDDPNRESPERVEFQMLLTYDPEAKNYPGIAMSGPSRFFITGTWDAKTQTMSFDAELPDGNKLASTHRFINERQAIASGAIKSPSGEVLLKLSWNQTRRDGEPLATVEFRLAEPNPGEALIEARVVGTDDDIYLHKTAVATSKDVERAKVILDETGKPAIDVTFTAEGAKKIAAACDAHLGKPMAIVVDGRVISAPTIQSQISRRARIHGNFSDEEAARIAAAFNAK